MFGSPWFVSFKQQKLAGQLGGAGQAADPRHSRGECGEAKGQRKQHKTNFPQETGFPLRQVHPLLQKEGLVCKPRLLCFQELVEGLTAQGVFIF